MPKAFVDRKCLECDGTGELKEGGQYFICSYCNGTGSVGSYEDVPELPQTETTEFGKWMRKARERHGTSLIRLRNLTGITPSRLSEIERGAGEPVTEAEQELVKAELRRIHREERKDITDAEVDAEFAEEDRQRQIRKAAPELLDALHACQCAIQLKLDFSSRKDEPELVDALAKARAAIAKAEWR